ncbi:hypothetical protein [Bradyrhizobium ivorense]|nr:hypothetical protein [Bradyrhizobium ivorense]
MSWMAHTCRCEPGPSRIAEPLSAESNGGLLGTYSTSERATGGHWWYNLSKASRDGDDYRVNVEKSSTTGSGQADYYIVQTRTPGAKDQADIISFEIGRTNVPSGSSPLIPCMDSVR